MVMFFDPNCPVCAQQRRVVKPYLDQVRIHWVPVAYLHPDSLQRAAAILAAADPVKALAFNEDHYDFDTQRGGYAPRVGAPTWALSAVRANTRSSAFNDPIAATPLWGLEMFPGKRYYRYPALIDARVMPMMVGELGVTMNPYERTRELTAGANAPVSHESP